MKIGSIIVTRSKSCHVKTLHSILKLNILCIQSGHKNDISFVNDDPYQKAEAIQNHMKTCDRILFVDFGIQIDEKSLGEIMKPHEGVGCLVFPGVTEGIDWNMFKKKVVEDVNEPTEQMGLNFDTKVDRKISEDIWTVSETSSRAWFMNCKNVTKHLKDKKSGQIKVPPQMKTMFQKFKENGVKIHAFTAAKLTMTYGHECISNILNAAGVKAN
jgi:hypothetical protein